jgi:hypothetical protein
MGVERRPADVGAVDDVLHRQRFESLLLNQRHQRAVEQLPRSLNAPIDGPRLHRPLTFPNNERSIVQ